MQTPSQRAQAQMHSQLQQMHKHQTQMRQGMDDRRRRQASETRRMNEEQDRMRRHRRQWDDDWRRRRENAYRASVRPAAGAAKPYFRPQANSQQEDWPDEPESHPVRGIFVLLLCGALTYAVGMVVGSIFSSLLLAGMAWIGGAVLSFRLSRRAWSGE
jgi:hypothetical protein